MPTFAEYIKNMQKAFYISFDKIEKLGKIYSYSDIIPSAILTNRVAGGFFDYSAPETIGGVQVDVSYSYGTLASQSLDESTLVTALQALYDSGSSNVDYTNLQNSIALQHFNVRGSQIRDLFVHEQALCRKGNICLLAFRNVSLSDYQSSYLKIPAAYEYENNVRLFFDAILIYFYYTDDLEYYSYYERLPTQTGALYIPQEVLRKIIPNTGNVNPDNITVINSTANVKGRLRIQFDLHVTVEEVNNVNSEHEYLIINSLGNILDKNQNQVQNTLSSVEGVYEITEGEDITIKVTQSQGQNYSCLDFKTYAYNKYKENTIHNIGSEYYALGIKKLFFINLFPIFEICVDNEKYIKANGDIKYVSIKLISYKHKFSDYAKARGYLHTFTPSFPDIQGPPSSSGGSTPGTPQTPRPPFQGPVVQAPPERPEIGGATQAL